MKKRILILISIVAAVAVLAVFSSVAMSGIPGGGGTGELVLCTVFFPEQMALAYPIAIALGNNTVTKEYVLLHTEVCTTVSYKHIKLLKASLI